MKFDIQFFEEPVEIQEGTIADDLPHERREQPQELVQVEPEQEEVVQNTEPVTQDKENKDRASEVPVQLHTTLLSSSLENSIEIMRKDKEICNKI